MAITAKQVNELRQITGAGMMDCKKALTEADGDMDKAIELLRKKGQKISAKRADKEASEGSVFIHTTEDGSEGVAFTMSCETDFVAKNEDFQKLGEAILNAAVAAKPADLQALTALQIEGRSVQEHITDLMGKIGEKVEVSDYTHVKAEKVVAYKHGVKIGVLVALEGGNGKAEEVGKDIAMQVAAMNPVALDEASVDKAIIEKEMELGRDKAREEGKPEKIIDRIAEGYVKKYLKENTLLGQAFVKDNSVTVEQYAKQNKASVVGFERVSIG